MWRFVAGSISKKAIEGENEFYRAIKIRVKTQLGVKVQAITIENPSKVLDKVQMLEKPIG
jgi:hypothetical protein